VLDITNLERRWFKYKLKRIFPYGLLVTLILVLGLSIPLIFSKGSPAPIDSLPKNSIKTAISTPVETTNEESSMILQPSMQFIQSMGAVPETDTTVPDTTLLGSSKNSVTSNTVKLPPVEASSSQSQNVKVPIAPTIKAPLPLVKGKLTSIKRDDVAFDIHEIEDRFKNNSNPNLGLYIAHYHYDHGNYAEAYNYALKTNAINSSMDDSWLIFAKSLVKLGKEDQAKKTLQLYISNSNSQNAKNYLETLTKETSK